MTKKNRDAGPAPQKQMEVESGDPENPIGEQYTVLTSIFIELDQNFTNTHVNSEAWFDPTRWSQGGKEHQQLRASVERMRIPTQNYASLTSLANPRTL